MISNGFCLSCGADLQYGQLHDDNCPYVDYINVWANGVIDIVDPANIVWRIDNTVYVLNPAGIPVLGYLQGRNFIVPYADWVATKPASDGQELPSCPFCGEPSVYKNADGSCPRCGAI